MLVTSSDLSLYSSCSCCCSCSSAKQQFKARFSFTDFTPAWLELFLIYTDKIEEPLYLSSDQAVTLKKIKPLILDKGLECNKSCVLSFTGTLNEATGSRRKGLESMV